ncbi:MAG: B12-binding domain-containing radical SAM protein [Planctomycetia bacterium]|nr:B12-binding domain-containing radical SAM protein [Planctomycetia bacterium]
MTLPGLQARGNALAHLPALGLLTLAGMLPGDWTCSYAIVSRWDENLITQIADEHPTLVAISALTASILEAYEFSARLRAMSLCTVLGGLHVTCCPDESLRYCDAIIVGPGELVWPQVLSDAAAGALRPVYQSAGIETEETWPVPRFDLLGAKPQRFTLQTQRGCPLACSFCGASRLLGSFREKPAENIRQELRAIRAVDPDPLIELADDNTFAGSCDWNKLLDVLQESGARYFTEADWRIGERPDLLQRLAPSGCVQILVGIESLIFRYPGMGQKQAELDRIMDAVLAIQGAGVAVNGCFIVGADGETRASLDRLVRFLLDSPLADVQITLQTPFPGTALHRQLAKQGRLLPGRGWPWYTLFDVTYQPDGMSVEELETGFRDVLKVVFARDAAVRRDGLRKQIWRGNARLRQ